MKVNPCILKGTDEPAGDLDAVEAAVVAGAGPEKKAGWLAGALPCPEEKAGFAPADPGTLNVNVNGPGGRGADAAGPGGWLAAAPKEKTGFAPATDPGILNANGDKPAEAVGAAEALGTALVSSAARDRRLPSAAAAAPPSVTAGAPCCSAARR
eukprot:COSAG01_NODE_7132_length_3336_cov_3.598703_2_plen_154_part_00